jgi:hypothetical protein
MIVRSFLQISRPRPGEEYEIPFSHKIVRLLVGHEVRWVRDGPGGPRGHVIFMPSWAGVVKLCQLVGLFLLSLPSWLISTFLPLAKKGSRFADDG